MSNDADADKITVVDDIGLRCVHCEINDLLARGYIERMAWDAILSALVEVAAELISAAPPDVQKPLIQGMADGMVDHLKTKIILRQKAGIPHMHVVEKDGHFYTLDTVQPIDLPTPAPARSGKRRKMH